jgi:hypothetical protein
MYWRVGRSRQFGDSMKNFGRGSVDRIGATKESKLLTMPRALGNRFSFFYFRRLEDALLGDDDSRCGCRVTSV